MGKPYNFDRSCSGGGYGDDGAESGLQGDQHHPDIDHHRWVQRGDRSSGIFSRYSRRAWIHDLDLESAQFGDGDDIVCGCHWIGLDTIVTDCAGSDQLDCWLDHDTI